MSVVATIHEYLSRTVAPWRMHPVLPGEISVDEQRDGCTHNGVVEFAKRVGIVKRFAVAHGKVVLRLVPQCLVKLSHFTFAAMAQSFDNAPASGLTCRVMFPMNRD